MTAPTSIAPWTRADGRATGRIADAVLIGFHRGALADDVVLEARRFGAPTPAALTVLELQAITDRGWLDGWRRGAVRALAEDELGGALADLDAADGCHLVRARVADPADHVHLQAAWAAARWLVARGTCAVLDASALRWHPAAAVRAWPADASFELAREVTVVAESARAPGLRERVVHTRGLGKVARPDVVTLVAEAEVELAVAAVRQVAARLADGWMPSADDARVELAAHAWSAVDLTDGGAPALASALSLGNDCVLLAR
ncbi:MAG: hypothetical protein R2939_06005 [Kofleriaceae bacterium]